MNTTKIFESAKEASYSFWLSSFKLRKNILSDIAKTLITNSKQIIKENKKDLDSLPQWYTSHDRLLLNLERIKEMSKSCIILSKQKDILWNILKENILESGIKLKQVRVPLWVIACIYEARPNVTIDIAAISIFSWNCCILRWWSDANHSNIYLIKLIQNVLKSNKMDINIVSQYPSDRKYIQDLFTAVKYIDLLVPRWWLSLIENVRKNSLVPVIETWAGVCHTYIDKYANIDMAIDIVINAKTQRPSVCNALDTMIIHEDVWDNFYKKLIDKLSNKWVEIFADKSSYKKFSIVNKNFNLKLITDNNIWWKEYLSLKMSVKTVKTTKEAISHINKYWSKHSESIITKNKKNADLFLASVDASCVYVNASTRFTDWSCFGLWAEVWIATQKLHSRWPMWSESLTTYKYLLEWNGQVRS